VIRRVHDPDAISEQWCSFPGQQWPHGGKGQHRHHIGASLTHSWSVLETSPTFLEQLEGVLQEEGYSILPETVKNL
jgi:hypothetical protein